MRVQVLESEIRDIGYPIGWNPPAQRSCRAGSVDQPAVECSVSGYSIILMPFGWLITALAVMLGAPFWFDVLNKFMVIRSTVKPREKSQEEASEDRQTVPSGARVDLIVRGADARAGGGA